MLKNNGILATRSLLALMVTTLPAPAVAQTFSAGEFSGFLNLEMSYGLRVRMEDFDKNIIGPTNIDGGAFHLNADDGNLNYEKHDIVANVISLKPEVGVKWRNFGFFASGYSLEHWYCCGGSPAQVTRDQTDSTDPSQ